jgi:hypothetical protein
MLILGGIDSGSVILTLGGIYSGLVLSLIPTFDSDAIFILILIF